ncbi:DUF5947 family protein [Streptomyces physcomitrii]|uniref:Uncharacterized protein n=1 Tax=Streptomyces physcomitrii TaxID=2724184 RepID=A0ABX1H3W0_9ACTN|nr:DUF5947 family protein [Streptomyces physcomitrii]NKI41995.1 hypothetical protein [Streptomyces physcomitrii]
MNEPAAPGGTARTQTGLRRFIGARQPRVEHCELCAVVLPESHRHLVDTENRSLTCACVACAMLFDRPGAATGRFRTVPDRRLRDPSLRIGAAEWQSLGIPVGMAYFFRNSALDHIVSLYPSPAGATESELDTEVWESVFGGSPLAAAMQPDVEALLVRRTDRVACYLVPIDAAYELVGRMRLHWQGFDGGAEARAELDAFFAELDARAVPVRQPEEGP